ncbi:hypothetical protein [Bacillus sp. JAS24-2]|uniref:hypothetical protein n=1 Tax=Bacillus sp. JAS24-2 TaxID=2217832 RepID=UPI002105C38B|nr:hypothetical protein [Bacillus sp. JAS24-2]
MKVSRTVRNGGRLKREWNNTVLHSVSYLSLFFTDSHESAKNIFHAVKEYLENHLQLNISREKSKITNITKSKSEFLGFNLKAVKKKNKFVANTHVSSKQKKYLRKNQKVNQRNST